MVSRNRRARKVQDSHEQLRHGLEERKVSGRVETVSTIGSSKMPEDTRDDSQQQPGEYNGWILPSPPSLDVNGGDPPGFQYATWKNHTIKPKKDPVAKMSKGTVLVKRKKRRGDTDEASCCSTIVTQDGTMFIRRSRANSSKTNHKGSSKSNRKGATKEADVPRFQPSFSQARYSRQQKFGALASYYKEKMKAAADTSDNSKDELVAIKVELSNLKEWAKKKRDEAKQKRVQFAQPLVMSVNYRPKTAEDEIDLLFFREDELLDWEEDRETTSSERFEITITDDDEERVNISADCRSYSSCDSHT